MSQDLATTKAEPASQASVNLTARRLTMLLIPCVLAKVIVMTLFSSDYENELFLPFIRHYLENFDNPWNYFHSHSPHGDEFPYQPLMLYIEAIFCAPIHWLGAWDNIPLRNFFFKLPTLLCDCSIAWLLFRIHTGQWRYVIWFYFLSPIVLYACYMHSQLDLIPTAFLFASFYFLRNNKMLPSCILYGLALSTKLHVLAAFPLLIIYLYRNKNLGQVVNFAVVSMAVYLAMVFPYFNSEGFQALVIANPKQSRLLEVYASIGSLKLYLPILATFIVYGRFALYAKINTDLLDAFLAIVFSLLVMLIVPAPGWYIWMVPFLSLFIIRYYGKNRQLVAPFLWQNFFYIVYFVFFDQSEYVDLRFLSHPLQLKIASDTMRGFVFTLLEVGLLSNIVLCYRAGVRSNSIYKRDHAVVIGIGGDSGAGKSTVLADIKDILGEKVVELEGDADHKWERGDEHWQHLTHLDPKANFLHRQAETILSLKRGRSAHRVDYDHTTGQFTNPKLVEPKEFVIMSGLHTFYLPKMRKLIDLKIFMDTDFALNAKWKLIRDQHERGYTEEQIMKQIESRRPDSDKFIAPQKGFADMVVRYFASEEQEGVAPGLSLKISLSSSVSLEELVDALRLLDVAVSWDYTEDLTRQEITLNKPVSAEVLTSLADEVIVNRGELIAGEIAWREGYRGFVQLIVLIALSELMQEREDFNVV